ncbi:hypothetical protein P175DRAFT_0506651 [Aspergillus ochraceoroseus IBT 24754]|uniref:DUF1295 domain protein n=2 Tax=Aspergillus subgen. Nidulantes TaxID=2720870 RepID=A0A0F8WWR7_9EURO|nr:uncharacterized protein P175DRAFT_0506651 [Aspergillus ochraceoroseus IBT 24754]KKK15772.1 hypothetical protein ARAM_007063 [Aspergillus rambellii]PTU25136.1 hypothetical protein P175DRAFT_0506651 [Aspergillus ochraceoroseus IBT 24754]
MASLPLPEVQSLADCVSFNHAVLPFLPQILSLPEQLQPVVAAKDVDALKEIYLSTNPLASAIAFTGVLAAGFIVLSELTRNYSQVDRLWSILPALYNVHFAVWARLSGLRTLSLDTIAAISILWSIRLTFNFWRKGGYSWGGEDYRWSIVRSKINNCFLFFLFNITFISVIQPALLLLITVPTYNFLLLARLPNGASFELADLIFSRVAFFFILLEHFADQQQWHFQKAKQIYQKSARIPAPYKDRYDAEDLERGFVVSGLWSLSRHPNFLSEQAIWLTLYLWSAYRTENYVQWTGLGVVGLLLIFQGSTRLTENISAGKYPEYKEYQARVGRFIPRFSAAPKYKTTKKKSKKAVAKQE